MVMANISRAFQNFFECQVKTPTKNAQGSFNGVRPALQCGVLFSDQNGNWLVSGSYHSTEQIAL